MQSLCLLKFYLCRQSSSFAEGLKRFLHAQLASIYRPKSGPYSHCIESILQLED